MISPLILEIQDNFPENIRKDIGDMVSKLDYAPIWQTIEWQLMLRKTSYTQKSFFVGIYEDGELLSYALVEKRSVGLGYTGFFCVGGPVIKTYNHLSLLSKALTELAVAEKVVFVQVEPLSSVTLPGFQEGHHKNFIEKHTAVINLNQDEEMILARMKPKGRYNIRVAEKAEVEIEQVPYTQENLDIFYGLLGETLERDGFAANSKEYFRIFLQYLDKQGLGGLFFAKKENEIISAGIFVFYKNTALYYYGASSSDNNKRKYMASYLLQWRAILEARSRGCTVFDFLGIADPADPHSPLAGVTDFKLKLTDETRQWPAAQILIVRRYAYLMLQAKKMIKKYRQRSA